MAHCPPHLLDDLDDVLETVRGWAGVVERKPYVFYVRREPFLHFHLIAGERRRADIKGATEWSEVDVPRPITAARRRVLMKELRRRLRGKG